MQRSLCSLLSVDVANTTGLMSGKLQYYMYVGKLSVTQILLSMRAKQWCVLITTEYNSKILR